ncbi:MAG: molybdenum cofactor guanylyltransferase [Gammaproteobacteria bacterium]|nr:molybdenum cofactor guanylyltransferase [Gammaproteobacteria bacterium]MDE0226931.1 molybdenum cofactor guanylyltransferase [Gammaproteobacteria bacterium]
MNAEDVTGIVFCGGSGRRLGGVEKPLIEVAGRPLLAWVLEPLGKQVATVVLSGADGSAYARFGCEIVPDRAPGEGPLSGLATAVEVTTTDWIFTCPGDTPYLAENLVELLTADAERVGVAVPHDGNRRQNLFLLMRRDRAESLVRFFEQGGRAAHRWLDENGIGVTDLSAIAGSFFNVNTPDDLEAWRQRAMDS